jgi:anti-sigma B factor antagonist
MPLHIKDVGEKTFVRFVDCRILDGPEEFQQLLTVVEERTRRNFYLDFNGIEYLSSAALGQLITLERRLRNLGGQLTLYRVIPQILEIFTLTKLDKILRIQEDDRSEDHLGSDPDDDEDLQGGVKSRLIPPKPSGKDGAALPLPPSEDDLES